MYTVYTDEAQLGEAEGGYQIGAAFPSGFEHAYSYSNDGTLFAIAFPLNEKARHGPSTMFA
jgi:hypothetical protein